MSANDDAARASSTPSPRADLGFLAGGGEMGELIRSYDWDSSLLGQVLAWPQSLRTAVGIMLSSRYPMFVWWGGQLVNLYNDAYRPFLGAKHPHSLGQSARQVWAEIWEHIGPRTDAVLKRGESTFDEALLLIMERFGYPEETYFTFSYSPIRSDDSAVGGIFCAVTDETQRVIGERRLRLLQEVAATSSETHTPEQASQAALDCIARSARDLPFALIYLNERDGRTVRLTASANIPAGSAVAAPTIDTEADQALWPLRRAALENDAVVIEGLASRLDGLPSGAWDRPVDRAVVVPLREHGQASNAGFLVTGLNPYLPFQTEYRGFVGLLADQIAAGIARTRAYQAEHRRAEALAEIDRAKTTFFSNVSHEFRTPLTLMLGPLAEAAADENVPAPVRAQLQSAHRNSMRLLKLVNSLLDFSRIEAGRVLACYRPTDLAALTRDLASPFRAAMERAGLSFTVECAPLGELAYVDREMWEKIVLNLLSNAFKYTLRGGITVRLQREPQAAVLEVQDTGVGIPPHELPHIFERFHRVEGTTGRTQEGSGIGLALVAELVKLHGGRIEATSTPGQGSTFRATVPLGMAHLPAERVRPARADGSTAVGAHAFVQEALRWVPAGVADAVAALPVLVEPAASELHSGAAERARILLADDNADMRDYVQGLLGRSYRVEALADGVAALEAARRERPDLIVADIMMPRLDGLALLQALRSDEALRDVPVILLSARAGEEARVEGLKAGADDYLVKPFSARELLARVSGRLELVRMRRENEERLRAFVSATSEVIYRMSPDWSELRQLQGRNFIADTQHPTRSWFDKYIHPDDQPQMMAAIQQAIRTGSIFQLEHRVRHIDGSLGWVLSRAVPLKDAAGEILEWFGAASDISERKRAEDTLRRSQRSLSGQKEAFQAAVNGAALEVSLGILVRTAVEQLNGAPRCALYIADSGSDDKHQEYNASSSHTRCIAGPYIGAETPAFGWTLARDAPLITADVRTDPRWHEWLWLAEQHGFRGYWSFPVETSAGAVIGSLALYFSEPRAALPSDREFAALLAQAAALIISRHREAEERARIASALSQNEARLRAIFGGSYECIGLLAPDGTLIEANRAMFEFGPVSREQMIGLPLWQTAWFANTPAAPERLRAALAQAVEGEFIRYEVALARPTGEMVTFDFSLYPVKDESGHTRFLVAEGREISALVQARAALEASDRQKDQFLAMLAHELRNPLASIGTASELLTRTAGDDERARAAAGMIKRQSTQLTRLVDDLLDVSRITQGRIQLRRCPTDLAGVIAQALETAEPHFRQKQHKVSITGSYEPLYVNGDFARLVQCIVNLLTNAAKYTDSNGEIRIATQAHETSAEIEICDTGAGIAPALLPRIFDLFVQSERTLDRSQGGLGIGLSVVKRLIEMHGGDVTAHSAGLGQGSRFVVRLPRIARPELSAQLSSPKAAPRRVLIVDDNTDAADSLAMLLGFAGHETQVAYSGPEALERMASFRPDVALLDIGLPEMDGYELAQRLRASSSSDIRLVALTGYGQAEDRQRARNVGFDDHLVKPVDLPALERTLAGMAGSAGIAGSAAE